MKHGTLQRLVAGSTCLFLPIAILPPGPDDAEIKTIASWYGPGFQGRKTASGERFDQNKLTAASRTLPFGTRVRVRNLRNGRTCTVVINDRGPFVRGRGIDLSREAARRLGITGIAHVCYSTIPAYRPQPKQNVEPVEPVESDVDVASLPASTRAVSTTDRELVASLDNESEAAIPADSQLIEVSDVGQQAPVERKHNAETRAKGAAKPNAPEPFERQIASLRSSLLIEQPSEQVTDSEVQNVVSEPAVKQPTIRSEKQAVKTVKLTAKAAKQASAMKQLVAKSTKIKVAKTKKVKQYIASAKQKRSKHSSYVVAHRKQNLKIARAAHRWGVKVANFCKGLKGIFASL